VNTATGVAEPPGAQPASIALAQNYPNPFNPTTRIPFSLHSPGLVTLKVFDMMGREVRTLVSGTVMPGHYEATFDADGLSSGIYLYRLASARQVETKTMLLLR
jgi:hypothetical protein